MKRCGFTLIELLIVIVIVAILAILTGTAIQGCTGGGTEYQGQVTNKWTELDHESNKIYRVQITSPDGSIDTFNSYFVHDQILMGANYRFKVNMMGFISKVKPVAEVPAEQPSEQPQPAEKPQASNAVYLPPTFSNQPSFGFFQ